MYTREKGEKFREDLEATRKEREEFRNLRQSIIDSYSMKYIKKHKRCEYCQYSDVFYNDYDYKIVKCELSCNKRVGKGKIRAKLCKHYIPSLDKARI